MLIINLAGWLGMVLILYAYYLNAMGRMKDDSAYYHLLNLSGALGIVVNTYFNRAWPAMTLNVFWFLIAVTALFKMKK